jgi:thiol-disulfide isomerase/thioredoxin
MAPLHALVAAGALTAQAPIRGVPAPDFELRTLEGRLTRLSEFRGRPLLVNFWASWCGPCRTEMPAIVTAFEEHRAAGLAVLAVNLRDQERDRDVRRFVAEFQLPFPVLLDARGAVRRRYRLRAVPTTVFIDSTGVVRLIQAGPLTTEALSRGLAEILPKP